MSCLWRNRPVKFVHFVANITNFGGLHGKRELQRKISPRIGDRFSFFQRVHRSICARSIEWWRFECDLGIAEFLMTLWTFVCYIRINYICIFVVILEIFWKKFQMFDSKKSVKIAPFISQLSWRVLKFWRRENFFQVKSYRSSYFRSRMGQYCWLQNFS